LTPQGGATRGALNSTSYGHQSNAGLRFQEDWRFAPRWHFITGLGGTWSEIGAFETVYSYTAATQGQRYVTANRSFLNLAPEAALTYAPTRDWTLHTRLGTAYATPSYSSFFVTPQGTYGANTQLKSQTSLGIDLGADWHPSAALTLQLTGFYEFYRNELVSQSPGVNAPAGNYTFNAPASVHRGVEAGATWQPLPTALPGARTVLSYTFDEQIYTDYTETLSTGAVSRQVSRVGERIPGVTPNVLDARLLYDQPDGPFEGLGGFAELSYRSAFFIDNADIVSAPAYELLNLEIHYDPPARLGWAHRLHTFFEVQNLANQVYAAGATNISDSLLPDGSQAGAAVLVNRTGSIYAGSPRAFFGGVRIRL
ncbi:MAG: TonB-dependent receptor, partial [Gluconacetobacter diazotrophicus]|nr:TonB-dependent receptor [Gluconacetobacter diazotrophicus]